jgi:hypothetical protein
VCKRTDPQMTDFVIDQAAFSGSDEEEPQDDEGEIDDLIDDESDCKQDAHTQYLQEQADEHAQEMRKYNIQRAALKKIETEKREEREALEKKKREDVEKRKRRIRKGNCIESSDDEMQAPDQQPPHQWTDGMQDPVLEQGGGQQPPHQWTDGMQDPVLEQEGDQEPPHQWTDGMQDPVLEQEADQEPPHQWTDGMQDPVLEQEADREEPQSDEELQSESSGDESDPNDMDIDMARISEPQNVCHTPLCDRMCAPCRLQMCLAWDKNDLKCTVKRLDFVRLAPDSCGFLVGQDLPSNVTCGSCVLIGAYLHEEEDARVEIPWEVLINNPPWLSDAQKMIDFAIEKAVQDNAKADMMTFIRYHVQHQHELQSYAAVGEKRKLCIATIADAIQRLFKEQLSLS